jgi:hypothetical protein
MFWNNESFTISSYLRCSHQFVLSTTISVKCHCCVLFLNLTLSRLLSYSSLCIMYTHVHALLLWSSDWDCSFLSWQSQLQLWECSGGKVMKVVLHFSWRVQKRRVKGSFSVFRKERSSQMPPSIPALKLVQQTIWFHFGSYIGIFTQFNTITFCNNKRLNMLR